MSEEVRERIPPVEVDEGGAMTDQALLESGTKFMGRLPRTDKTELRFQINSWQGSRTGDIRLYYGNKAGEWAPTRKGIQVPVDELPALLELVRELIEAAERQPASTSLAHAAS